MFKRQLVLAVPILWNLLLCFCSSEITLHSSNFDATFRWHQPFILDENLFCDLHCKLEDCKLEVNKLELKNVTLIGLVTM